MEFIKATSGLALISSYSDDDEDSKDDDNSLVQHDSELKIQPLGVSGDTNLKSINSLNRLPLPSSISQLFKDTPSINGVPEDDPEQHDGRIRSFPHQRGNWSTYVYVPYELEEGFPLLLSRLQKCASLAGVSLKSVSEPHISLTRTVVLLHHWIDSFVTSLKTKLSHLPRFSVQLGAPAVYCNEEQTRTFLGLRAVTGATELCAATHMLDDSLAEFRLPPFYKDPSFHMSVLWVVGDARSALETVLPKLQAEFEAHVTEYPHELYIDVAQCLCRSGNKTFTFPLASL